MPRTAETLLRNYTGEINVATDYIGAATPPARVEFLIGADIVVLSAALCYCQPALMFDSIDTDTRRFTLITPPFALQALGFITSWGETTGAFQDAIETAGSTMDGGSLTSTTYSLTPDANTITTPSQAQGTAVYADTGGGAVLAITTTADTINRSPGSTIDRQINLTEGLVRQVEDIEIKGAQGFGLYVTVRSKDMETVT
jgi:hypothetical protein